MPADTTPSTAALGLSEIKTAITEGAKDGAAVLASNTMVALLYKLPIAEKFPEAMRTEMGRKVVQAILPFLVYLIATLAPAYVPSAERVKAVSVRAIRGNTILFAASLAMFMDMFRELASIDTEAP